MRISFFIRHSEHQLDYSKDKVTPAVTLFLPSLFSLSVCIFPSLTGHKCQAGGSWAKGWRSVASTFPEARASVSLCYKSFRDSQKGHNTFFLILVLSSLHPFSLLHYWVWFLWAAPNLSFGSFIRKRNWGVTSEHKNNSGFKEGKGHWVVIIVFINYKAFLFDSDLFFRLFSVFFLYFF